MYQKTCFGRSFDPSLSVKFACVQLMYILKIKEGNMRSDRKTQVQSPFLDMDREILRIQCYTFKKKLTMIYISALILL